MGFLDGLGNALGKGVGTPWGGGGVSSWYENVKKGDPATHDLGSMIFTGTPFSANLGAQTVGNTTLDWNSPTAPPDYQQYKGFNPDEYKGFDNSAINQNMQRDIASGAAQRKQQQLAQLSKMGVHGADSASAMGRIGADQERAAQGIQASLARQQYEDAWKQYLIGHDDWNNGQDRTLAAWQASEQNKADAKASNTANLGTALGAVGSYFGMKKGK